MDLNKYFSNDNFPIPFIYQITDECVGNYIFFLHGHIL